MSLNYHQDFIRIAFTVTTLNSILVIFKMDALLSYARGSTVEGDIDIKTRFTLPTLSLTQALIEKRSVTPVDNGCMELIQRRLGELDFKHKRYDHNGVSNLYSSYRNGKPILAFVGHTDVVPPGDLSAWRTDPFTPTIQDNHLYGRGSVDMKSAIAAMVVATEEFDRTVTEKHIDIAFAITSDEEGDAIDGIQHLVKKLEDKSTHVEWALVGEPSSESKVGDTIKVGRRGSLTATIDLYGKQGHVGYPTQVINPLKAGSKLLAKLQHKQWDLPSRYFPATSLQVVRCESNSGAENMTPSHFSCSFNLRFSPKQTVEKLIRYIEKKCQKTGLAFTLNWKIDAQPFLTHRSLLRKTVATVITQSTGHKPKLATSGGTSDGRFFAEKGTHVVEYGLCNRGIHQPNERVNIDDLGELAFHYYQILLKMNQAN